MDTELLSKRLGKFLTDQTGADVQVRDLEPLTGGYSLFMARFVAEIDGEDRRLVVRANRPEGEVLSRTDRAVEWELLRALSAELVVPMPAARWADVTGEHLGVPAIIIDFVDGHQLLAHSQTVDPVQHGALAEKLAEAIGTVHRAGAVAVPASFQRPTSWDAYIDGFISGWRRVEAEHAERMPFIRWVAAWLDKHRPPPAPLTLVHGEFQSSNVMLDAGGELRIVDWEYAHIGDPRVDLGWAQQCAAFMPPDLIGANPAGFTKVYREVTGLSEEVVNPLTIAWFAILAGYKALGGMLQGMAAMANGQNHLLASAYLVSAMPFTHRMWREGVQAMEAAMSEVGA